MKIVMDRLDWFKLRDVTLAIDIDGTLCMNNDWWEGQQLHEIDYWFPLPRHPDEPKRKLVNGKWIEEDA